MNYYRRFIPKFEHLAQPLNYLTRRKTKFVWTEECERSFVTMKENLIQPKNLQYPDFSQEFTITVDASDTAAGAVLSQERNGKDEPISFASRGFTQGEKNKSTIEKELAAIHFAITHFRPYVYGTHFLIRSDHRPLAYLFGKREPSSKLTRMRLDIEEYRFTIEYIKGSENVVADALSRITIDHLKLMREEVLKEATVAVMTRSATRRAKENEKEKEMKMIENDENENVHEWNGARLKTNTRGGSIPTIEIYKAYKKIIEMRCTIPMNNVLFLETTLKDLNERIHRERIFEIEILKHDPLIESGGLRVFMEVCSEHMKNIKINVINQPERIDYKQKQIEILQRYHDDKTFGGHVGKRRLLAKLTQIYYWKGMSRDVGEYVRKCNKCQMNKTRTGNREEMAITDTPLRPFDIVEVDTIGPLKATENGNVYAITLIDEATKFLTIIPTKKKDA